MAQSLALAEPNSPAAQEGAAVDGQPGGLRPGLVSSHLPAKKLEAKEHSSPVSAPSCCWLGSPAFWQGQGCGPHALGLAAENSSAEAAVLSRGRARAPARLAACRQWVLLQGGSGHEGTSSLQARTELGAISVLKGSKEGQQAGTEGWHALDISLHLLKGMENSMGMMLASGDAQG